MWIGGVVQGGGGGCGLRGSNAIAKNCGKTAEDCGKIAIPGEQPSLTHKVQQFGQVAQIFSLGHTKGPRAAQLQEAPLNITMELEHESKEAVVVVQFVLPLRNRPNCCANRNGCNNYVWMTADTDTPLTALRAVSSDPGQAHERDMCAWGGKMPGASSQSHDASGWGSSKMGTSSPRHHERAPHLSQYLNPPTSPPTHWRGQPPSGGGGG